MKIINQILQNKLLMHIFYSVAAILVSVCLYRLIYIIFFKRFEGDKINNIAKNKAKTYIRLLKNIVRYTFVIVTVIVILRIFGVNVTSLVAGIGIAGAIIGLAIQDWLKDIIRGSSILSDNYFSVGDVVMYKEYEGKVISLGLKTTKIEELKTGNIISIANRNIDEIQVVSENVYLRIPMPYEVTVEDAEEAMNVIISKAKTVKGVKDCSYKGVAELADSSIKYMLLVKCNPAKKLQTIRNVNREILLGLKECNIQVPYNQIDIHNK